jgi:hypothetical protein
VLREIANTGRGDAFLFRISEAYVHQVKPVQGTAHKTAFAGWFRATPTFAQLLEEAEPRTTSARG